MTVIHKQRLDLGVLQSFRPEGEVLKLLDVQFQHDIPCLWYETDPDSYIAFSRCEIHIQCVGTGFPCPEMPWVYISTTQFEELVWHWYGKRVYGSE